MKKYLDLFVLAKMHYIININNYNNGNINKQQLFLCKNPGGYGLFM